MDNYQKQPKIDGVALYKSYKLPEVKYSGVPLKCCINIYKRGEAKTKRIKGAEVYGFSKKKGGCNVADWEAIHFDFRAVSFGTLKILDRNAKTYCGEIKITFDKKRNFEPILKAFLDKKSKESVSSESVTKQEIINLIYDTYEDLRAN